MNEDSDKGSAERRPLLMVSNPKLFYQTSDPQSQLTLSTDDPDDATTTPDLTNTAHHNHKTPLRKLGYDPSAFQFALRMAILLTLSSLFVLIKIDNVHYPDGMWVLVSVLFVCWFPALDAASVIEKIIQRLLGTFIGATLGLSCGFFSITFLHTRPYQACFLGLCMLVGNFSIIFVAGSCKAGTKKVIRRFAYATILCVLTFCICMLPFGLDKERKWELGVWRICNVIVGCVLGALGSIVVCPKSTAAVLHEKAARQVHLAGEASEAVLHLAADLLAGKVQVNRLADELLDSPLQTTVRWKMKRVDSDLVSEASSKKSNDADVALKKYEDAIADWNASKALFPLAKYDPFGQDTSCNPEIARTLARALRIQTTIVVLDGLIRSDPDNAFTPEDLRLFHVTGTVVKKMLSLPFRRDVNDAAALSLFDKLDLIRHKISSLSYAVGKPDQSQKKLSNWELKGFKRSIVGDNKPNDDEGRGIPKFVSSSNATSLFFLQLVEHLILRSLRLYQAWKQVEYVERHKDESDDLESVRSMIVG